MCTCVRLCEFVCAASVQELHEDKEVTGFLSTNVTGNWELPRGMGGTELRFFARAGSHCLVRF